MPRLFLHLSKTGLVCLLAFAVALHALDARTFHGDELGSVYEAEHLGLNANSIPYFVLLRLWLTLGNGEFWLRALSGLVVVAVVAITFAWTRALVHVSLARFTALTLATSPFLIVYSQQVRFYTLGLVGAGLATWAFVHVLKRSTPRSIGAWMVGSALAIAALLMNGLLVIAQVVTLFFFSPRFGTRTKIVIACAVAAFIAGLLTMPSVRAFGFDAVATYTNSQSRYGVSRGWTSGEVAKILFTFYFFGFGEAVYPLTLWFVIPAAFVLGIASWRGARILLGMSRTFWFITIALTLAPLSLFFVLDPLAPLTQQGAGTRYLIFLLPLFYFVLAAGVYSSRCLAAGLLGMNVIALLFFWYGDWIYTDDRVNWRDIARWASDYVSADTLVLLDGQSHSLGEIYLPGEWKKTNLSATIPDAPRMLVMSYNWHPNARVNTTRTLDTVLTQYETRAVRAEYPFFGYVLDRRPIPGSYTVGANGQIDIPIEIYGIEYQDLSLPFYTSINHRVFTLTAAFGLPGEDGEEYETIPLAFPRSTRQITLFSHIIDAENVPDSVAVANLKITSADGRTRVVPLRAGYETGAWDATCRCSTAYRWHKRAALVGLQSYPGAWREFDASIFVSEMNLDSAMNVRALEFERVSSPGKFYVWGVVLDP